MHKTMICKEIFLWTKNCIWLQAVTSQGRLVFRNHTTEKPMNFGKMAGAVATALALTFGAGAGTAVAAPVTVDFSTLAGANGDPFVGVTENGFTVTPATGSWFQAMMFGNPLPSIFVGPIGAPSTSTVLVTGGLFGFDSVDLSSNSSSGTSYLISGFLGGVTQFAETGSIGNINTFNTIASTFAGQLDALSITVTPAPGVTSINLDNIRLETLAAVPEPGSLALVVLACAAMGASSRPGRRR